MGKNYETPHMGDRYPIHPSYFWPELGVQDGDG